MNIKVLDATEAVTIEPIEYRGQIVITTSQLADSYESDVKNISNNFNNHKGKFKESKHYFVLTGDELREFKGNSYNVGIASNVNKLYLWTHKGASRHCKILDTDKAWEQFDILEENYFENDKSKPQCMEDIIIYQMNQMKNMKQQLNQINSDALRANRIAIEAKEEAQTIKDVVSLDTTSWRSETQSLIAKIAKNQGGFEHINLLKSESYELLNKRFGVSLETRLKNKKSRMALEGVSKTKINNLNNLDVIAEDKKLIEGYVAIVKDMAIKYGI